MTSKRGIVLKSARELALMREAGKINARALAAALEVVGPGVMTADVNRAAVPGAYPYPAETTISINDELVHGIPGDRRLEEGDIVSIDCGTICDGFVADSALTVGVGEIAEEAQKLLRITREALFEGINKMIPGNSTGDVSEAIQAHVEGNGFHVVREYTGHGVGRSMHEEPQVPNYGRKGHGVPLKPGMTIALEPMVMSGGFETRILSDQWTVASKDGRLTAHFEHSVAVTENGPWILTAMDEELDEGEWIRYNNYFAGRVDPAVAVKE